jgi:hypothetical protein
MTQAVQLAALGTFLAMLLGGFWAVAQPVGRPEYAATISGITQQLVEIKEVLKENNRLLKETRRAP